MAPTIISRREGAKVPLGGQVFSVILALTAVTVLTLFLTQRVLAIKFWRRLPPVVWLVFAIYIDSYMFVVATAILQHSLGVNSGFGICEAEIILCLACYVTTKIFIYLFLVEKAVSANPWHPFPPKYCQHNDTVHHSRCNKASHEIHSLSGKLAWNAHHIHSSGHIKFCLPHCENA